MNSKEDERVAHCSVEEWEAGSIRVARVVVEIDASLAGSYVTTFMRPMPISACVWDSSSLPLQHSQPFGATFVFRSAKV
jgi:hypothetical protein